MPAFFMDNCVCIVACKCKRSKPLRGAKGQRYRSATRKYTRTYADSGVLMTPVRT
jgi:hypothetical protein